MNEDLFELAKKDYAAVKKLMPNRSTDEYFLSIVCYHYQQAIEKLLKYLINLYGEKYPATHDIAVLCNLAENLGIQISNELGLLATTLTDWESKTRYNASIVATIQQLDCVDAIYTELLAKVEAKVADRNKQSRKVTEIKAFR